MKGRKESIKGSSIKGKHTEGKGNTKADCTAGYDLWGIHGISERQTAAVGREETGGT